jgi:hypothetical protein
MAIDSLIATSLGENRLRTDSEQGSQSSDERLRLESIDVRSTQAKQWARDWLSAGIESWGKQDAFAARIGVTKSVLSEMLSGAQPRALYLVHALPLLGSIASAKAFTGWQCRMAGLQQPELADTVQLTTSEVRLLSWLMSTPAWSLFLGVLIARKFYRVELELLEVAVHQSALRT